MQTPLSVKVSRAVFDGIHRAWATDPKGKLRYSISGTAAMCKRLGEREAAEWVEKHDYAFGLGVWHGFHVDGEYPGEADHKPLPLTPPLTKSPHTTKPYDKDRIKRSVRPAHETGDAYQWPWNSHPDDRQDSAVGAYIAATGGSPPPIPPPGPDAGAPLTAEAVSPLQQDPSHAQSDTILGLPQAQNALEEGQFPAAAGVEAPLQPPQEPSFPTEEAQHPAEAGPEASYQPVGGKEPPHPPAEGPEGLDTFVDIVEGALDDPEEDGQA